MVAALRERCYPVRYLVAPDEGHEFRREQNLMAMYAAIEAFLAEHIGGRFQVEMADDIRQKLDAMTVDPEEREPAASRRGDRGFLDRHLRETERPPTGISADHDDEALPSLHALLAGARKTLAAREN